VKLGNRLKHRRETEVKLSQHEVAKAAGCSQGYYAELEAGTRSSDDIRLWLRIAESLQLPRRRLLMEVWQARGTVSLALPTSAGERDMLIDVAIRQAGLGDPLPGLE
jgi:transcriptional regulator with XRE-family HTH domain